MRKGTPAARPEPASSACGRSRQALAGRPPRIDAWPASVSAAPAVGCARPRPTHCRMRLLGSYWRRRFFSDRRDACRTCLAEAGRVVMPPLSSNPRQSTLAGRVNPRGESPALAGASRFGGTDNPDSCATANQGAGSKALAILAESHANGSQESLGSDLYRGTLARSAPRLRPLATRQPRAIRRKTPAAAR